MGALLILQYAEFYFRLEYSCYQEIFQSKCSNGDFFPFLRFVLLKANILLQKFLQEVFLRNQNASNSRCPMLAAAGKIDTLLSLTKIVKNYTKTPQWNFPSSFFRLSKVFSKNFSYFCVKNKIEKFLYFLSPFIFGLMWNIFLDNNLVALVAPHHNVAKLCTPSHSCQLPKSNKVKKRQYIHFRQKCHYESRLDPRFPPQNFTIFSWNYENGEKSEKVNIS